MEVQQNKKYIAPTIRVIAPICSEETLIDFGNGSGSDEAEAKQHTSFSSWDDEEEAED